MLKHILFGLIPKIRRYNLVYTGIANNGKLTVNSSHVYKHPMTHGGFMHVKLIEIFCRAIKYIFTALFFNTNPYFAATAIFGLLNGLAYPLLFFFVKYCHLFFLIT